MDFTKVLLKPLLTEKTTLLKEEGQVVCFMVHPDTNKIEIKQAVEKAFNVKVQSVNVIRKAPSDRKRQGRVIGRVSGSKKAYVTLVPGEKIEFFEGV
ncbi:MAG: 50S ribosomal protein L23 [Desulfovibrionaceae bacterium]|jgi:large subunit ribosomal protein L23|nr:50S ribosomal protein L23 [Desulfovibrionaceae bacterium]